MKHYQDTKTGNIYAFNDNVDIENEIQNNRNIPKTLSSNIKQKPSNSHIWHNENWIHEKDKPLDYKEPISDIPAYNPAWVSFLFKEGTILFDSQNKFEVTLNQINNNTYKGDELAKVIMTLPNDDKKCILNILITVDGSIMIPLNDIYSTQELAVNKINEIISALFLGGINLNAIHLGDLEQGKLLDGGNYGFSYKPSIYNRFRLNGSSISERAMLISPDYINIETIKNAYTIGIDLMKTINFNPIFLVQGYHSMQFWKTADALSNLWIVVEQLTDLIWNSHVDIKIKNILKKTNVNIETKHKVFKEYEIINESTFQTLLQNRRSRNKLLHEGKLPEHSLVEKLWIVLFKMFEIVSDKKLDDLFKLTVNEKTQQIHKFQSNSYNKNINPQNINFDDWISTIEKNL